MLRIIGSLAVLILLAGCATSTKYGPMTEQGGYEDSQIATGAYRVRVSANAKTSMKVANEYLQRRMAELCDGAGYGYYVMASFVNLSQSSVEHVTGREGPQQILISEQLQAGPQATTSITFFPI